MKDSQKLNHVDFDEEIVRGGRTRYIARLHHIGLEEYRTIKDYEQSILMVKVKKQSDNWDKKYLRKLDLESREKSKYNAETLDAEARNIQDELNKILHKTLDIDDTVNWEILKDKSKFDEPQISKPSKYSESQLKQIPKKPNITLFEANLSFLDRLIPRLKRKKIAKANEQCEKAVLQWIEKSEQIAEYNKSVEKEYDRAVKEWEKDVKRWNNRREKFLEKQNVHNQKIEQLKAEYQNRDKDAMEKYCEIVLDNSDYSHFDFPRDFELEYNPGNSTLIVEYSLPTIDDIPNVKGVKFIASKGKIENVYLSQAALHKVYDNVVYQIILRSVHEIFEADSINGIEAVVFNGWVNYLDKSIGKRSKICIASIHTNKNDFLKIDLHAVEPKLCFKGLKGVASTKISSMSAIAPILQLEKNDTRFTHSKEVIEKIDKGDNLAIMNWEDFEHLIRELFHKEFSGNGGEVKVTQSSRDGGVDAIAFDPDPIRGGKIVIQAKRYTNTVGVAAVRDLWGTTMNEGASKGIIVTTSDYGPDAYSFAQGKPLTLLNGNNLLYLLEKHGYQARIDTKEAR